MCLVKALLATSGGNFSKPLATMVLFEEVLGGRIFAVSSARHLNCDEKLPTEGNSEATRVAHELPSLSIAEEFDAAANT